MSSKELDFFGMLECFAKHKVQFIIVGGVSAVLNGAPVVTFDMDIVHSRQDDNIKALVNALQELDASYRHHPKTITPKHSHLITPGHQLLKTKAGYLDVLGTIDDGKDYDALIEWSHEVSLNDHRFFTLKLERLIEIKQRAGRDKDNAVLPVLINTLKEQS